MLAPVALPLLLAGCALPFGLKWPRLPWHKPRPIPEFCIVSLEAETAGGISAGNEAAVHMPCKVLPSTPEGRPRKPGRS
jgi:hypothetical protein